MNTIALDTNIAIDILNGDEEILHKYEKYSSLHLPVTVCGELLFGADYTNFQRLIFSFICVNPCNLWQLFLFFSIIHTLRMRTNYE